MIVLGIESSTRVASVALARDSQILCELSSPDPKSHSEFINPAIDQLLAQAKLKISDIELLAVDIGPGSFTGIRVATNVARGLGYLLNLPVFAAESLDLLLRQTSKDCVALLNAYKNMLFISHRINITTGNEASRKSAVIPVESLESYLLNLDFKDPIRCVGDGYDAYYSEFSENVKKLLVRDSSLSDFPSASTLCLQALSAQSSKTQTLDWKSIIPLYLRASAAEETLKSR